MFWKFRFWIKSCLLAAFMFTVCLLYFSSELLQQQKIPTGEEPVVPVAAFNNQLKGIDHDEGNGDGDSSSRDKWILNQRLNISINPPQFPEIEPGLNYTALKYQLNQRFWSLIRNISTALAEGPRFFTKERLLDLEKFNLFRPDPKTAAQSFFVDDDRLIAQLVLGMEGFPKEEDENEIWQLQQKTIFLPNGFMWWFLHKEFEENLETDGFNGACASHALNKCVLIDRRAPPLQKKSSDMLVGSANVLGRSAAEIRNDVQRRLKPDLKVLYYELESPFIEPVTIPAESANSDWLSSFWRQSDIVTPYDRWEYYDLKVIRKKQDKNYAEGKTRFGAIFMSNCHGRNHRLDIIHKLQKSVQIDIYGACGDKQCTRDHGEECLDKLEKEYKFYFAFENANCQNYITEKFFLNALKHNVIAIVFGGHPDDYRLVAPSHSYIHIEDFESSEKLVEYLQYLDRNDTAYNEYFEWKGTGDFVNTKYFCRVCTMLHYYDYLNGHLKKVDPDPGGGSPSKSSSSVVKLPPVKWTAHHTCSKGSFWTKESFI